MGAGLTGAVRDHVLCVDTGSDLSLQHVGCGTSPSARLLLETEFFSDNDSSGNGR